MKNLCHILAIVSILIGGTEIASAQYWDDLYIRPSTRDEIRQQREKQAEQERAEAEKKRAEAEQTYVPDSLWNVDAYNRRYEVPEETAYDPEATVETAGEDTTPYADDEGYYLNGFYGTQSDLEYAERIRKFHNPRFTVHITDPAYTEIYFLNSNDWNVYIDGTYAYVTPTWTNPWYWDYMWSPYSYWGPSWRWSSYYWGWGYPYYGFGWSWGYPYYHHHHHHYGPAPRPPHRPDYRPTPSQRPSYSPGGWSSRRPGSNTSVTRPSGTNSNRVITNSQNQRVRLGNTSRSSQRQSTTRQIETQRNYNQSYTPSYNSNSSRGSSISSGSSGSSRGSMSGGSRGGTSGGSRSRR